MQQRTKQTIVGFVLTAAAAALLTLHSISPKKTQALCSLPNPQIVGHHLDAQGNQAEPIYGATIVYAGDRIGADCYAVPVGTLMISTDYTPHGGWQLCSSNGNTMPCLIQRPEANWLVFQCFKPNGIGYPLILDPPCTWEREHHKLL